MFMKEIELLAPAGSYEALVAAIQNGADAIYLGGMVFGARAYATNFDLETLEKAVDYAHVRGVKVYVTINTLVKDREIVELVDYVTKLYNMGIDAVIVQDLGVMKLINELFSGLEIHCSTQMALHNSQGIMMLKKAGAKRVVLARELSIKDIREITRNTGIEIEVFVHGALCYCYSGLCLMSSLIGGRSGNRGRCAQPCRRTYEILPLKDDKTSKIQKAYYMSTRDLKTIENIGKIIESGVTSLKIEGRMKKPQYVASIVRSYRKSIDNYMLNKTQLNQEATVKEITQIFNRKFTKGYLLNSSPEEMLNVEKPNNRGIFLGRVENYDGKGKKFKIKILEDIRQGDGIEIWSNKSENPGGIINKMYKENKLIHEAKKGDIIEIQLFGTINKGDEVYKTLDLQLMRDLEKTYSHDIENRKVKIYGEVNVERGMPLKLHVWDMEGNTVHKETETIVEEAEKVPLTAKKLTENLRKLGNTPFQLEDMKVELQSNVALPISIINQVRREAIEELVKLRINKSKRMIKPIEQSKIFENQRTLHTKKRHTTLPKLSAKVDGIQQLKNILEFPIDRIYYGNILDLQEAVKICKEKGVEVYYRSPSILKDKDQEKLRTILHHCSLDGILAGELGIIDYGKNIVDLPVIADTTLNVMNSKTISFLQEKGIDGITISTELDLKNIKTLEISDGIETEAIIYGKLPVMITETCPLASINKCHHQCNSCSQNPFQYLWGLKDEKKAVFPFTKDNWGRTIIVNNHPLYIIDKMDDLKELYITSFRLDFTDEEPPGIRRIMADCWNNMKYYYDENTNNHKPYENKIDRFTRGHYYRGVE
ncbi:putative protease [Anaerovirgula multivorans]|uniref:Putative protease n=2 Tax=Anaerovirgula multivorans TaxID=312168 RepID=A0A239J1G0_9FIRM|nr:putative protease [Anaerovirgula multivorans]